MKTLFYPLLAFLLATASSLSAQDHTMMVEGQAQMAVAPDQVNLRFSLEAQDEDMGAAMESMRQETAQYVEALQSQGFKEEEIGTVALQVNRQSNYRDGKRVDLGYQARQQVVVQFPFDKKRLSEILKAVAKAELNAQFSLNFTLSDQRQMALRDTLLVAAVNDARRKASLISTSAQVVLGPIASIEYGSHSSPRPVRHMDGLKVQAMSVQSDNYQVNPEAIILQDRIVLHFRIATP